MSRRLAKSHWQKRRSDETPQPPGPPIGETRFVRAIPDLILLGSIVGPKKLRQATIPLESGEAPKVTG